MFIAFCNLFSRAAMYNHSGVVQFLVDHVSITAYKLKILQFFLAKSVNLENVDVVSI